MRAGRTTAGLHGWPIVGWATLGLLAMCGLLLALDGGGEQGLRVVIRATARTSVGFFSAAFAASAARQLWPRPATAWLLANRRYLGVSFAVSHFLHLIAIVALVRAVPEARPNAVTLVAGGLGYVFVLLMAATSFDRTAAWLGARRWRLLHLTGGYYLWFVFLQSYAPRAATSAAYLPVALLLVAVAGLRAAAALRRRHRAPLAASRR
jgi:methionine sulfoxide reductase heme-binding subunit